MSIKDSLIEKKVAFKQRENRVHFGVIRGVESDGFWVSVPEMVQALRNDASWSKAMAKLETQHPIFFLPTTSLDYLIVAEEQ